MINAIQFVVIILWILPKSIVPFLEKPIFHSFSSSGVKQSGGEFTITSDVVESPWTFRLVAMLALSAIGILYALGRER